MAGRGYPVRFPSIRLDAGNTNFYRFQIASAAPCGEREGFLP